jgi:hypothetical protein
VLLRVTACGICGTDVRAFYNGDRRISAPWVLGHEISGELIEIGSAATEEVDGAGFSIGDHVHCISTLWCGTCRLCRSGAENLCLNGELMGFDHQGAYAELVAIPQIALKNLFRIPDGLSDVLATFADPALGRDLWAQGHLRLARRHGGCDRRRSLSAPRTRSSPVSKGRAGCSCWRPQRDGSSSRARFSVTNG